MNKTVVASILTLAAVFLAIYNTSNVVAQGTITVAPAIATVSLASGQSQAYSSIAIKNDSPNEVSFLSEVYSVEQSSSGKVVPKLSDDMALSAVSVTPSSFSLASDKSINLQVAINDSNQLSPGGHYAAVVVKQTTNSSTSVGLQPAVTSLLYFVKESGALRSVELNNVEANTGLFSIPNRAVFSFKNTGNVDVVPRAIARVYDPRNREVSSAVVNQESIRAPSGQSIQVQAKFTSTRYYLPGKYTLIAQYRYEGSEELLTYRKTMVIIPLLSILAALAFIVLASISFVLIKKRFVKKRNKASIPERSQRKIMDIAPPRRKR